MVLHVFQEFTVKFHGPKESPYEGGIWKVTLYSFTNIDWSSSFLFFLNVGI